MAVYEGLIEGLGVRLRPVEEDDAAFVLRTRQDRERARYLHATEGSEDDQRRWIHSQREREGDYYFVAEDLEGSPFGLMAYYDIVDGNGEIGRMIINGHYIQNCDAILQIRRFAFEIIGADHVRCTVVNGNKPVMAQLKRFGGEQVGSFVDEEDGSEVLEFRVSKAAYLARRDKLIALVKRGYEALQKGDVTESEERAN